MRRVLADSAIVWGSSYSASLVFRLGAEHADSVAGVIGFSPAGGGPVAACAAQLYVEDLEVPAFALRPSSEMDSDPSKARRDALVAAGVDFLVVENGAHGSSMLVDERAGSDMSEARAAVMAWLKESAGI